MQNISYFKGSELSLSMTAGSGGQRNPFFQAVNHAGHTTIDLYTQDERKEGGGEEGGMDFDPDNY